MAAGNDNVVMVYSLNHALSYDMIHIAQYVQTKGIF